MQGFPGQGKERCWQKALLPPHTVNDLKKDQLLHFFLPQAEMLLPQASEFAPHIFSAFPSDHAIHFTGSALPSLPIPLALALSQARPLLTVNLWPLERKLCDTGRESAFARTTHDGSAHRGVSLGSLDTKQGLPNHPVYALGATGPGCCGSS